MQRWDYAMVGYTVKDERLSATTGETWPDGTPVVQVLNGFGLAGWELVNAVWGEDAGYLYYFKRPLDA